MAFNKGKDREEELKAEEIQKLAAETNVSVDVMAKALAAAMQQVIGPRQNERINVKFGMHSVKTPFNPKGKKDRPCKYRVYQNGYWVKPRNLHDEELEMINSGQIKPGKYINSLVRVLISDEDTPEPALHFNYKNERADQRMALGTLLTGPEKTGFARMMKLIINERAAQDAQAKINRRKQHEDDMKADGESDASDE